MLEFTLPRVFATTFFSTCLLMAACACFAGEAGQISAVEVQDEPHHHTAFENSVMRLYEVELAPQSSGLYHRHLHDNVAVFLTDAEWGNQYFGERKQILHSQKAGRITFNHAPANGYIHQVSNEGSKAVKLVNIEFFKPTRSVLPENPQQQPAMENEWFRAYRISLEPGQTATPLKLAAGIRILVGGTQFEQIDEKGGIKSIGLLAHAWQWRDAGSFTLRNSSPAPVTIVELELK